MHEIQPGNQIRYGLAWMHQSPIRGLSISGHSGGYPGVNTWMLYNKTKDIGVIYLANGNPGYALPCGGWIISRLLLDSLFTKERTLGENTQFDLTVFPEQFSLLVNTGGDKRVI